MSFVELDWIKVARSLNGIKEIGSTNSGKEILSWATSLCGGKPPSYIYPQAWCGTFVAYCLQQSGMKRGNVNRRVVKTGKAPANHYPHNWYGAKDYITEGGTKLAKPAYGCVAVKGRTGGGHVCFVVGRDKRTNKLVCLGGNQGNKVCYALYADSEFDGFFWYGRTASPAANRFNLPVLNGVTAANVTEA